MPNYQLPPIDNPKLFEQMIADLLNEHYHTLSFKCFGKNGHEQKGIDIYSAQRAMVVQCKHKDLSRSGVKIKLELLLDMKGTALALQNRQTPLVFGELILATTASEHPEYDEYAAELKMEHGLSFDIFFWGWETIQQRLGHLPKTLAKYYPQYRLADVQEEQLLSRLSMKKSIERDFGDWLNYAPENRKKRSRMIIHSSTDTHYPEHPNGMDGPWFWFGAEIMRLSTRGLGFTNDGADLYVNERGQWTDKRPGDLSGFTVVRALRIDVIDFNDIVDYDLKGDEHYNCPHFYVRFNENNSPFSKSYYQKRAGEAGGIPLFLDDSTKIK